MTKRQERIQRLLWNHYDDIRTQAEAELRTLPIGYTVVVRLPSDLKAEHPLHLTFSWMTTIEVVKDYDQLLWREFNPAFFNRKGRTEPQYRPL